MAVPRRRLSNCPRAAKPQVSLPDSGRCVGCATNVPANVRCGLSRMEKRPLCGMVGRSRQGGMVGRLTASAGLRRTAHCVLHDQVRFAQDYRGLELAALLERERRGVRPSRAGPARGRGLMTACTDAASRSLRLGREGQGCGLASAAVRAKLTARRCGGPSSCIAASKTGSGTLRAQAFMASRTPRSSRPTGVSS